MSYGKEDFIRKAIETHGNKYDYSKVNYINSQTKISIICPIHGEFLQKPNKHLLGQGCPLCSVENRTGKPHKSSKHKYHSFPEFVEVANKMYENKYTYDEETFNNRLDNNKIKIFCPIHGEFLMSPTVHLSGQGCPQCGKQKKKNSLKSTREEFIERATKVHEGKYHYGKVEYINTNTKVVITCPIHGDFEQKPSAHLQGQGCPKCSGRNLSQEDIIRMCKEVHGNRYDYSKTIYNGSKQKMIVTCPKHGDFEITPYKHIQRKQGCVLCNIENQKLTTDDFIERARQVHGNKYDYSKVNYKKNKECVEIICPVHGSFLQLPIHHLSGCGCPVCNESRLERTMSMFLTENNIKFEREKTFPWLRNERPLFIDFYLTEYNVGIECQGIQHFTVVEHFGGNEEYIKRIENDTVKKKLCYKHGLKMYYFTDILLEKYPYKVYTNKEKLLNEII